MRLLLFRCFHLQRFLKIVQEPFLFYGIHGVEINPEDGSAQREGSDFAVPSLALQLLDPLQVLLFNQTHKIDFRLFQLPASVVDFQSVLFGTRRHCRR